MNDMQKSSLRIEELSQIARYLAVAAVKARRSSNSVSTANQDISVCEDDPTYQAWFRYFLQLQLQDSQIRSELVQRNNLVNTVTGMSGGTPHFNQINAGHPIISSASPLATPCVAPNEQLHGSQSLPGPVQCEQTLDPAELARCRLSDCTPCGASTPLSTKDIITQLLQSPVMKQSFQDPRVLQQILQQNYIAQMAESAGLLSADMLAQRPLQSLRLDCGSTGSLPSYMTMNSTHPQSGDKSASISPSQRSNPLYYQDNLQLSRGQSITSSEYGHVPAGRISPAEVGPNVGMESTEQSRTETGICHTESGVRNLLSEGSANVCNESSRSCQSPVTSSYISVSEQEQVAQQSASSLEEQHYLLRPRLRATNRDRFLVRVIRVTYQCSCRSNPSSDQVRVIDSKRENCQSKECKGKEPRTYVTFQAQLPSISLSMRSNIPGITFSPATGLRLGFSCSLSSQGPALQDFASPKVAERLDAWEKAGNMPGFRCQVLSALHDTVGMMLQRIRDEGVQAIKLDTDYVFYPPAKELRPAIPRRRQLSSSSDSSITRMATRHRLTTAPTETNASIVQQASSSPRFDPENPSTTGAPVQKVWSEVFNCYETTDPHRRPRTWHHEPNLVNQGHSPQDQTVNTDSQPPGSQSFISNGMSHLVAPEITRRMARRLTPSPLGCQRVVPEKFNSLQYGSGTWSNYNSVHLQGLSSTTGAERPTTFVPETACNTKLISGVHALCYQQMINETSPQSMPTSPTKFLRTAEYHNLTVDTTRLEPQPPTMKLSNSYKTAPNSPFTEATAVRKKTISPSTQCNYFAGTGTNTDYSGQQTPLDNIVHEIITRLQNNPQLPLVVMPASGSNVMSTSAQLTSSEPSPRSSPAPLIFQLPHPDAAFVCLPASPEQMPRVVTAPKSGTLVVIPASSVSGSSEPNPPQPQQPLVLTGPRPGYFLMITSENRFEYVPINYRSEQKPQ
ncbi:hypothetical protein FGIG_05443 [Fasciola gigantica]|uniref:Uncharacterized protein n=1 Tax=Fasciola gigantica TaxID=46835 RepID=A0A504YFF1_FASGI|nr:hypothetical protein FGIG_05443 [Fasciola gigantica]